MIHATSTRFIGWCPVCERDIKVRSGLVHHGYERPGVGYIIGDCPGVHYQAYEQGTSAAEHYLRKYVIPTRNETQQNLQILNAGPPWLFFQDYDFERNEPKHSSYNGAPILIKLTQAQADKHKSRMALTYARRQFDWETHLHAAIVQTESKLRFWDRELVRIEGLIKNWTRQPLRTIEQEIEKREQSKSQREAAKQAERDRKIADQVAKMQKRIDSAVRNKNSATLADIYESNKIRELSGWRLTDDQALALLERDHVWRAFGLLTPDGYLGGREAQSLLQQMSYGLRIPRQDRGFDRAPLPWPPELGGGIAKMRYMPITR